MLLYIENNFSIVNGCISNKSGFNWIRIFAFLKCFGSALWLQRHSRVQVSYFLTQLEFSDLFLHDKRVYSAGLLVTARSACNFLGTRLSRMNVIGSYCELFLDFFLNYEPNRPTSDKSSKTFTEITFLVELPHSKLSQIFPTKYS
jgi:hypothetical protein